MKGDERNLRESGFVEQVLSSAGGAEAWRLFSFTSGLTRLSSGANLPGDLSPRLVVLLSAVTKQTLDYLCIPPGEVFFYEKEL